MPRALVLCFLLFLFGATSCEKDDVCPAGTQGTPSLIIRLYDKDNPAVLKAPASSIDVFGLGREDLLTSINSDSTAIQLNTAENFTQLSFVRSETATTSIIDTLQFNYRRQDIYFNRACGYRAEFILENNALESLGVAPPFYAAYTVLIDTLKNENQAHLALYH